MDQPNSVSGASQWDSYADRLRTRLPAAPEGPINGYVRWAPWIAIVVGAFGVLALLTVAGIGLAAMPLLTYGGAAALSAGGAPLL